MSTAFGTTPRNARKAPRPAPKATRPGGARPAAHAATGKKVVDTPEPTVVTSPSSNPVTPVTGPMAQEHTVNLIKDNKARKGHNGQAAHYNIPGLRGSVKISSTLFDGDAPQTLEINWPVAGPKAPKVKMTKEERAAANAAKTPMQKLAEQEARLKVQSDNLAARKAKLAGL